MTQSKAMAQGIAASGHSAWQINLSCQWKQSSESQSTMSDASPDNTPLSPRQAFHLHRCWQPQGWGCRADEDSKMSAFWAGAEQGAVVGRSLLPQALGHSWALSTFSCAGSHIRWLSFYFFPPACFKNLFCLRTEQSKHPTDPHGPAAYLLFICYFLCSKINQPFGTFSS